MSRWLKSVNTLLENLDGQAETVRENTDLIDDTIGQLLEKGKRSAVNVLQRQQSSDYYDGEETDVYSGEEEEEEGYNDDDDGYIQEADTFETDDDDQDKAAAGIGGWFGEMFEEEDGDDEEREDGVSDISFPQYTEDEAAKEEHQKETMTGEESLGVPPRTASQYTSTLKDNEAMTGATILGENNNSAPNLEVNTSSKHYNNTSNSAKKSPTRVQDESPRPPRRSVDRAVLGQDVVLTMEAGFLDDDGEDDNNATHSAEMSSSKAPTTGDSVPPRPPTRQSSFPAKKRLVQTSDPVGANENEGVVEQQLPPAVQPPMSTIKPKETKEYQTLFAKFQSVQNQLNKMANELKSSQSELPTSQSELKASQTEIKKLQNKIKTLDAKLDTANAEIAAQSEELQSAAGLMEKERKKAKEEREYLLDDHDEELDELKKSHGEAMDNLRKEYKRQVAELKEQLQKEEHQRKQEDEDWTKEVADAAERERNIRTQVNEVKLEKATLQSTVSKLEREQESLKTKLESAIESAKAAEEQKHNAEDKLDDAMTLHARQMTQRQHREAELETTVSELGAALTEVQKKFQSHLQTPTAKVDEGVFYKEKYEGAAEELETVKVQLKMEIQRRGALQQEVSEISMEREEEALSNQTRQREYDENVACLENTIAKLQKMSLREQTAGRNSTHHEQESTGQATQLSQELKQSKAEIARLSEQLMRHQGLSESSKAEILALKGRLRVATSRADEAEKSLSSGPSSTGRMYDMEGGATTRRRIKGGARARIGSTSVRSIRSALKLNPGRTNPFMEQVAVTVDGIDSFMVDTGSFMRHEPLARLGFVLYLMTLHLWTFALIAFHTTETPHADFGSLDNNPRHWRQHR